VFGLLCPFGSAATSTCDAQLKRINLSGLFATKALLDLMLDTMVSFAEEHDDDLRHARDGIRPSVVEVNVPDAFFQAPQHRRTQAFLSQIIHLTTPEAIWCPGDAVRRGNDADVTAFDAADAPVSQTHRG
jgi:hypothetical protein